MEDDHWDWKWTEPKKIRKTHTYFNSDVEEFENEVHAYPVGRPKKPTRENSPYRRPEKKAPVAVGKSILKPVEPSNIMDLSEPELPAPASESFNENKMRVRNKREYKFDPWKKIKNLQVDINVEELVQISPFARNAVKTGITATKANIQEVNAIQNSLTPAYAIATIQGRPTAAIVDSGAGICIISQLFLTKLGWDIDQASNRKIVVADGTKATALGEMKDIPVCFGNCTIPIHMTVCDSTTYDIILGTDWLLKAQAKVDFAAAKMRITYHGQDEEVPLDLTRGARPSMVDTDEESENESNETNETAFVNAASNSKKWPKAQKPLKMESDDEYPTEKQREKENDRTCTFEEWYERKMNNEELIERQLKEFQHGPIEEICDDNRLSFEKYKYFRQYFQPTELFHKKTAENIEMHRALQLHKTAEEKRLFELERADRRNRLPWQQALRSIEKQHPGKPCPKQPRRTYPQEKWNAYARHNAKKQTLNPWAREFNPERKCVWDGNHTDYPIDQARELDVYPQTDNQYLEAMDCVLKGTGWFNEQERKNNWSHCGANDDKNWESQRNPIWTHPAKSKAAKPQAQETIYAKNLKKGRCSHGVPWYHAETECGWCRVDAMKQNETSVNFVHVAQREAPKIEEEVDTLPTVKVKPLNGWYESLN